jgi:hypothetical protein
VAVLTARCWCSCTALSTTTISSPQTSCSRRCARSAPHAPDIAFPYGDQSYWHNRADGAWGSYVLDEVIPKALTVLNADPRRVAIGGISMGGFGAYALARLEPGRFCAVGGHSAAISPTYSVSDSRSRAPSTTLATSPAIT